MTDAGWAEQRSQKAVIDGAQGRGHAKWNQHQDSGERHAHMGLLHPEQESDQRHCRRAIGEYG
jgi:hypothetical protein